MVEPRRGILQRLSLAGSVRLVLVTLTLGLALIAALGIGNLYDSRQDYEDELATTYELELASQRLLAAGVIEETAFRQQGRAGRDARRLARDAFDAQATQTLGLAQGDADSVRLVRARVAAERRARRLAGRSTRRSQSRERSLASAIFAARQSNLDLSARQRSRRAEARRDARDESRSALLTTGIAGGLALLAALALVGGLIATIRRPLDELVGATRRLARGDLGERVQPSGPQELRDLDSAFNAMAEQLQGARDRIEEEREKLSVTIESLGDGLVVCDARGVVTAVNPRMKELAPGLEPGKPASAGENGLLPDLREALSGEAIVERGERTLSITAARLGAGEDEGTVWTIRDISERARLEQVKSDFVATASHELRSPLTSIKGFVELLARSQALDKREREFVDVILQSTDRLVDLVNDLLDVARLEAGKMEVHPRLFDLSEVVREVAALMAPRLSQKDQRLDMRLPPTLPRALADPVRVRQIVTNLLSNAHAYTGDGGRLAVDLDHEGRYLTMAVSDNGRGMTAEEVERAFDRFVRRDDGASGTGLGLSIVKSLVDLQGGEVGIESEPGKGTTFTVKLPAEPEHGRRVDPRFAIRGKRVLVVDDQRDVAELIAAQLEPYDVQADIATGGEEALRRLAANHYDALTLDLLMPDKSGLDVLRQLRDDPELRRTPVVVVSILSGHEALFGEWKVAKPIDSEELADALGSAVLAGRTRVLVVGRSAVRPRLEPALVRLGLDHEWVTSGTAAAQACERRRFEIALVDAGMRNPDSVMRSLDLRGRRMGQAVLLFSAGDEAPGVARLAAEPVRIEDAAGAVLQTLSQNVEG